MDDHGLAVQHPLQHLPGAVVTVNPEGHGAVVVGVGRADDRHRETFRTVLLHQEVLAGDLVAGVLPIGVHPRRPLRDEGADGRLLVGRRAADIHVLLRPSPEEPPVAFHLGRHETDKIAHAVPLRALEQFSNGGFVVDVGFQDLDVPRDLVAPVSPVQKRQFPFSFRGQLRGDGGADRARTADEQCFSFHFHSIPSIG